MVKLGAASGERVMPVEGWVFGGLAVVGETEPSLPQATAAARAAAAAVTVRNFSFGSCMRLASRLWVYC